MWDDVNQQSRRSLGLTSVGGRQTPGVPPGLMYGIFLTAANKIQRD